MFINLNQQAIRVPRGMGRASIKGMAPTNQPTNKPSRTEKLNKPGKTKLMPGIKKMKMMNPADQ